MQVIALGQAADKTRFYATLQLPLSPLHDPFKIAWRHSFGTGRFLIG